MGAGVRGMGTSRLLGTAKLQSAPGADNPRYTAGQCSNSNLFKIRVC